MSSPGLSIEVMRDVVMQVFTCPVFYFLLGSMLLDLFTGVGKAFVTGTYSSSVGIDGVVRHSMVLLLSIFLGFFFRIFSMTPIALTITGVLALNYTVSVLENIQAAGGNLPDSVKNLFLQMRDKAEEELVRADDVNVVITKNNNNKKKGVDR